MKSRRVVMDAPALVDLLLNAPDASWVRSQMQDATVHAPSHLQLEVLMAFGRMWRSGSISATVVGERLAESALLPIEVHPLEALVVGGWQRRDQHALPDALYIELAVRLDAVVITTDRRLARATRLAVGPPGMIEE